MIKQGLRAVYIWAALLVTPGISLNAQGDTIAESGRVIAALNMDESLPFLQDRPLYLEAQLDKESMGLIRDGISRKYYVRQRRVDGRILFDTIQLTGQERRVLDSLVSGLKVWTKDKVSGWGLTRKVIIYQRGSEAVNRVVHQVMEPLFLRERTLAFAFYKREGFDKHAEFTLLIKQGDRWELWNKIIIIER